MSGAAVPAETAVGSLLAEVRPALAEAGDLDLVSDGVARVLAEGGSAGRQRAAYRATEDIASVVDLLVAETAAA